MQRLLFVFLCVGGFSAAFAESCHKEGFCTHEGATLVEYHCDYDNILDLVCTDTNGNRGVIRSQFGCDIAFWPQAAKSLCPDILGYESCDRPGGWCTHDGATFEEYDCDGDGALDLVCYDTEGHTGTLLTSDRCNINYPDAPVSTCPDIFSDSGPINLCALESLFDFLFITHSRTGSQLAAMTSDDIKNTAIVEINIREHIPINQLRAMTNAELLETLCDPAPDCSDGMGTQMSCDAVSLIGGWCIVPESQANEICLTIPECEYISTTTDDIWNGAYSGMVQLGKSPLVELEFWSSCSVKDCSDGMGTQMSCDAVSQIGGWCIVPEAQANEICLTIPECEYISTTTDDVWNGGYPGMVQLGKSPLVELKSWSSCPVKVVPDIDLTVVVRVVDATTGDPIQDAEVTLVLENGQELSGSTDAEGSLAFTPVHSNIGDIDVEAIGFIPLSRTVNFLDSTEVTTAISPVMDATELRAILTWGKTPSDLDVRVEIVTSVDEFECEGGLPNVLYYMQSMCESENGATMYLDIDKTGGFGPETITFSDLPEGIYSFKVENYWGDVTFGEFSGAVVTLISGSGSELTFQQPDGDTPFWHAFNIRIEASESCDDLGVFIDVVNVNIQDMSTQGEVADTRDFGCKPTPPPPAGILLRHVAVAGFVAISAIVSVTIFNIRKRNAYVRIGTA